MDIELRVHGVSGTPPESLLDRSAVRQVAGDRIAGFYRPADGGQPRDLPAGKEIPVGRIDGYPWLEGYSWGGLTSGGRSRALWIALAPFAFVNIAPRMLPAVRPGRSLLRTLTTALIRLLGATLTVTFVLGFWAPMAVVAVRCGAADRCPGLSGALVDALGRFTPSGRLLCASVVSVLILGVLWAVSLKAGRRYGREDEHPGARPAGRPDDDEMPLRRPDLWIAGTAGKRLRSLHFQLGILATVVAAAGCLPPSGLCTAILWAGGGLSLLFAGGQLARPDVGRSGRYRRFAWVRWGAVLALAAALVVACAAAGDVGPEAGELVRRTDGWVLVLFTCQAGLVVLTGALVLVGWCRGAGRRQGLFLGGFAAVVIVSAGWMLGVIFAAGAAVLIPVWVLEPGLTFTPSRMSAILQAHADWFGNTTRSAGISMLVAVGALVLLAVQLAARWAIAAYRGGDSIDRDAVRSDYGAPQVDADPARARKIAAMYWLARRVEGVPRGIGAFVLVVWVMIGLQGLASMGALPGWFGDTLLGRPRSAGWVAWGVFLTAGLLLLMMALGVAAYRTRAMRRGVGVLWDVVCCWPRDTHPFAPPCYNERVMPELTTRITYHLSPEIPRMETDKVADRLVVAAHSQGTVMSAVVVGHLPADQRDRVALLTFGTVLDRIYARAFPRYFSPEWFGHLRGELTRADQPVRWLNLWRQTDYLGGPVPAKWRGRPVSGSWPEDRQLLDPGFGRPAGDLTYPEPGRHSGYWLDPEFQADVVRLVDRIAPPTRADGPDGGDPRAAGDSGIRP